MLIFLVLVWVVVLALWGRGLLVGILWSWGALCFGGLAVSFGFSCGLGFVVAMAWCVVLVLGVVFWWWRRAVFDVCVLGVRVCVRVWWLVCAGGCGRVGWCAAGRKV